MQELLAAVFYTVTQILQEEECTLPCYSPHADSRIATDRRLGVVMTSKGHLNVIATESFVSTLTELGESSAWI